ncbi:hypothetical protein F5141DRAFT_1059995 [Pisolithus sp. B1]|nr:hypothetical protein F5141DRAFT_1059995 [Pisolithus sp. B1]
MSISAVAAIELSTAASAYANPLDERSSVRFDTQCVVIPEPSPRSRRPRLVTKTYSVPLWKRRGSTSNSSEPDLVHSQSPEVDNHVVLKLSLPRFQARGQLPTRCADSTPLTPCLVHRSLSVGASDVSGSPPTSRLTRSKSPTSPTRADLITVPLRPCCAACQEATDAARSQGDTWMEHFSPAAYYRRCHSTDSHPRTMTVAGSAASAFYGSLARDVPISVDEVDKRRRTSDSAPVTSSGVAGDVIASEDRLPPTASDSPPGGRGRPRLPPIWVPQLAANGISEEVNDDEEDQLFPLPSPRRSPCSSASPSPSASSSSLQVGQVSQVQNLTNSSTSSNCSAESSINGQYLCPPAASSFSLSLPGALVSTPSLTDDPPRAPSPNILASLPSLSSRQRHREMALQLPRSTSPENIFSEKVLQPGMSTPPLPSTPKRAASTSTASPSTSPALSTSPNSRRLLKPFSGSPRQIIADVIRGVGAFGTGGSGLNVQMDTTAWVNRTINMSDSEPTTVSLIRSFGRRMRRGDNFISTVKGQTRTSVRIGIAITMGHTNRRPPCKGTTIWPHILDFKSWADDPSYETFPGATICTGFTAEYPILKLVSSLSPAAGTFAQRLYASGVPKSKSPSLQTQNAARVEGLAAPPRSADRHVVNQRGVYTDLGITPAEQQLEALSRDFGSKAFLISSASSPAGDEEWDRRPGNSDEKRPVPSYTATFTSSPTLANSHDHAAPGLVDETPRYEAPASSSTIIASRANDVPQGSGTPADYSDVIQPSSASPVSNTPSSLDPLPPDAEDVTEEVPPYTLVDETPPPPDLNDTDTGARESNVPLDTPAVEDPLPAVPSYTPADSLPVNPPDHRQRARSPASSTIRGTTWQLHEVSSDLSRNERPCRLSTISSRSSSTLNSEFAADLYGHPYGRHSVRERVRSTSTHANSILAPPSLMFLPPTATDETENYAWS